MPMLFSLLQKNDIGATNGGGGNPFALGNPSKEGDDAIEFGEMLLSCQDGSDLSIDIDQNLTTTVSILDPLKVSDIKLPLMFNEAKPVITTTTQLPEQEPIATTTTSPDHIGGAQLITNKIDQPIITKALAPESLPPSLAYNKPDNMLIDVALSELLLNEASTSPYLAIQATSTVVEPAARKMIPLDDRPEASKNEPDIGNDLPSDLVGVYYPVPIINSNHQLPLLPLSPLQPEFSDLDLGHELGIDEASQLQPVIKNGVKSEDKNYQAVVAQGDQIQNDFPLVEPKITSLFQPTAAVSQLEERWQALENPPLSLHGGSSSNNALFNNNSSSLPEQKSSEPKSVALLSLNDDAVAIKNSDGYNPSELPDQIMLDNKATPTKKTVVLTEEHPHLIAAENNRNTKPFQRVAVVPNSSSPTPDQEPFYHQTQNTPLAVKMPESYDAAIAAAEPTTSSSEPIDYEAPNVIELEVVKPDLVPQKDNVLPSAVVVASKPVDILPPVLLPLPQNINADAFKEPIVDVESSIYSTSGISKQVKVQISKAILTNQKTVSFTLSPEDLGSIEINFTKDKITGFNNVTILTEKYSALEVINHIYSDIEQALNNNGFKADNLTLNIDMQQNKQGGSEYKRAQKIWDNDFLAHDSAIKSLTPINLNNYMDQSINILV